MFVASHRKKDTRLKEPENQFDLSTLFEKAPALQSADKPLAPQASLPGDNRALEPPDPIPNSVVKRCIADGSVGYPHVRVGHRQALILKSRSSLELRDFFMGPVDLLQQSGPFPKKSNVITF